MWQWLKTNIGVALPVLELVILVLTLFVYVQIRDIGEKQASSASRQTKIFEEQRKIFKEQAETMKDQKRLLEKQTKLQEWQAIVIKNDPRNHPKIEGSANILPDSIQISLRNVGAPFGCPIKPLVEKASFEDAVKSPTIVKALFLELLNPKLPTKSRVIRCRVKDEFKERPTELAVISPISLACRFKEVAKTISSCPRFHAYNWRLAVYLKITFFDQFHEKHIQYLKFDFAPEAVLASNVLNKPAEKPKGWVDKQKSRYNKADFDYGISDYDFGDWDSGWDQKWGSKEIFARFGDMNFDEYEKVIKPAISLNDLASDACDRIERALELSSQE